MGERLGQHFLHDKEVLDRIVDAADPNAGEIIVEIGPGKGALTKMLLPFVPRLIAIEKDSHLTSYLRRIFSKEIHSGVLDIIERDIRDFDPTVLCEYDLPYTVVANIPYYITGEIVRMFLSSTCKPLCMTLLVQDEVAKRIIASDGKESILSISVKAFGTPSYVSFVPKSAFSPIPKVDSAILRVDDISNAFFKDLDEELFFILVKKGFIHKRKKLINNLKGLVERDTLLQILEKHGFSAHARAEELSLQAWKELSRASLRDTG